MTAHIKTTELGGPSVPDRAAVEAQLQRILASSLFRGADRLSRFLHFAVTRSLDGCPHQLKEYVVGREAFDRKDSFDPRIDPIVRVEAGRLRLRLRKYYETEGRGDPVHIDVPKGSYVAAFLAYDAASKLPPLAQQLESPSRASIAVLPFADHSPEKNQEYFCDGMTEELITALTKVEPLRVVAAPSSFRLKGRSQDIRKVGDQLKVATVLQGSVRKAGDRVRITAQLIQVADGSYLWSETFDRRLEHIFAIQEEISQAIVETLRIHLVDGQKASLLKRYTNNPIAHHLYLKGRFQWNMRSEESLQKAGDYFQQAIAEDSNYALAYTGLADASTLLGNYGAAPPTRVRVVSKVAAKRAVEIDASLAEAHTSLAHVLATYDWDWKGAEEEYRIALSLNPAYATARHWYSITYLAAVGRLDEALAEMTRARELDPLSLSINRDVAMLLLFQRRCDEAIAQAQATISLDSTFAGGYWALGLALEQKARYAEAVEAFQKALLFSHGSPRMMGALGHGYALWGKREQAVAMLYELESLARNRYVSPFESALIYIGLDEREPAFEWLQKACEVRAYELVSALIDPRYDGIRSDPRFHGILTRIGFGSACPVGS